MLIRHSKYSCSWSRLNKGVFRRWSREVLGWRESYIPLNMLYCHLRSVLLYLPYQQFP